MQKMEIETPSNLFNLIPKPLTMYSTRNSKNAPLINVIHNVSKNKYFLQQLSYGKKLDPNIHLRTRYLIKQIWEFIRPSPNSILLVCSSSLA